MPNIEVIEFNLPHSSLKPLYNPVQVLSKLSSSSASGRLQASTGKMKWNIYLSEGQLKYASNSKQSIKTLDYHFRCLGLKDAIVALKELPESPSDLATQSEDWLQDRSMNQIMYLFQDEGYFDHRQMTQLLENLTKEALESFLWLTEAEYQWSQGQPIPRWETTGETTGEATETESPLDLEDLVQYFQTRQLAWQQLSDLIQSPHQRPYLFGHDHQTGETQNNPALGKLNKISKLLRGLSIRQIALILNQDELKVARMLYPYIQKGDVYLRDPKSPFDYLPPVPKFPNVSPVLPSSQAKKTYQIACIDDSPTILEEMQKFLGYEEYEVTKISDPVKAASQLFRLKPDLILMDITMPEINGYKLCGLLRNSVALRETPIIMVTGRTGLIDKARAKMSGANDYLAKPFTRGSLLSVVEKNLN
jgi:twitching motility two-component system response regulator PilG